MKVGFAGTGRMAAAMARRLMETGHAVFVWNRTAGRVAALVDEGAVACATPAALADAADAIVTVLSDAAAIDAVYRAQDGLLAGALAGKLAIDMSTVRPQTSRDLGEAVVARGAAFVDCPVGGTVAPAREGRLFGFAGGADRDVARAMPILRALCRRVEHVGPVGAGAAMKLAINLPLLVYYQALGEAYALCRGLGLEPERVMDIFADTSGAPAMLKGRAPAIAKALKGEPPGAVNFDVDLIRKDLRTMIEEAESLGARSPVAAAALAVYDEAAAEGWGDRDGAALPAFWPGKQ